MTTATLLRPQRESIPEELRARSQWIVWRLELREGEPKPTKVPYYALDRKASSTDAATWLSFDAAWALYERNGFDGVGYVFSLNDPYCGIDLDPELPATDRQTILQRCRSYTELSPSGRGQHIIIKATLPSGGRKKGPLEIYDRTRYFTMTGQRMSAYPPMIEERQETVDWLLATYFQRDTKSNTNGGNLNATDAELLARAFDAANGDKLRRLWNGDITGYPSASEADMALASLLAFWTGPDREQLERLMRTSKLVREKWDTRRYGDGRTYLQGVIAKALAGRTESYTQGGSGATSNGHARVTDETDDAEGSEEEAPPDGVLIFPELAWREAFGSYREAFKKTCETPDVFHFAGLWIAAAIRLQRRLSVFYGYPMHPNVYLLLYAPTGESKTTTLRQTVDLFPIDGRIKKLNGVGSAEALADWLTQQEEAPRVGHVLLLEELASLLTRGRWEGSTLIPFLTEVFDTPPVYEIPFRKNPVKLIEPTVSLVACTTPDWFWRGMRKIDIYGGFGNRFLMLTGEPKTPVAMPKKPATRQLETVRRALETLDSVPSCEVSLAPDAAELWQNFYATWQAEPFDPLTKAATKRIPAYILKLALVYAAFEATVPAITVDQLTAAIAVGHYASKCAALLMAQHQAQSEEGRVEEAIRQRLRERSHTKRSLKNALGGRIRATLFNRVIEAMVRSDEVVSKQGLRSGQVILSLAGRCK